LLDYLAARFMADGWSIKKLHRMIMLSAVYQQSSDNNPACAKVDPDNRLLWRMNRQRLEFEALRDSILAVSGKLDLTPGGHSVDITDASATRRTVYGFVDRQNLPGLFRSFDFASPDTSSPRRFFTTVPQQALFLMNSPFIVEQAKAAVNRPDFTTVSTDQKRIDLLYQRAFQRDPSREEIGWAREFIHASPATTSTTNWLFAYGRFDRASSRVVAFRLLPFFNGLAFQGGSALPDPILGWVALNDAGGHPGNDEQHAAIRRWVAPRDGTIAISGALIHPEARGNGVRGRIVSSKLGLLGEWLVHNKKVETDLQCVSVQPGDTIDFVADCNGNESFDAFEWAPKIRYLTDASSGGHRMEWNASSDFIEAAQLQHPALNAWEKYAQTLLMSDEFEFVD
jgi:hypothetical protein